MSLIDYPANNSTHLSPMTQDEIDCIDNFYTIDMSVEEELDYYGRKPLFGEVNHNQLEEIWNKLQYWDHYFENKSELTQYIRQVRNIITKIKSENRKTSQYYFGFELDDVLENALQSHYKETGHYHSHQIYDLNFAFDLYFYCCRQDKPKLIIKYFGFIDRLICDVLSCKKCSRYKSLLNDQTFIKIGNKLKRHKFKNKILNWISFSKKK